MIEPINELYRELAPGGVVLLVLLGISVLGWGRALWWYLTSVSCTKEEREQVNRWLQSNKHRSGGKTEQSKQTSDGISPPPILYRLLESTNLDRSAGEKKISESLSVGVDALTVQYRAGIHFVGVCASVLPLLGLFGTLLGIIQAFDVLSIFGSGEIRKLSQGISQALITTQAGLLLALPLLFFYRYMWASVKSFSKNLELIAHDVRRNRDRLPELQNSSGNGTVQAVSGAN